MSSQYIDSYYTATARLERELPTLSEDISADICIIGAGYMGLSSAIHLAEKGYKVVVLEAERVAWGASGRNGGHASIGQRKSQLELEQKFGMQEARKLWDLSLESVAIVRELIERFDIACDLGRGNLLTAAKTSDVEWCQQEAEHLQRVYNLDQRFVDLEEVQHLSGSKAFKGGLLEYESAHLHPLNFALGLAAAAQSLGVQIFENSRVHSYNKTKPMVVRTDRARVTADYVVLACNGYLEKLEPRIAGKIMPINNYILATEKLSEKQRLQINPENLCMFDAKFVVNYWKLTADGRMLFGGGETYRRRFPNDIKSFVRKHLIALYPQLADTRIEYAWGGTLAVTMNRLPCFGRLEPDVYYAMGFSGHGVAMATFAGKLIAEAISGTAERFDVMSRLPSPTFPGGTLLRWPGLVAGMLYHAIKDKLGD